MNNVELKRKVYSVVNNILKEKIYISPVDFNNSDKEIVNKAISSISTYVFIGNRGAYEGLCRRILRLASQSCPNRS